MRSIAQVTKTERKQKGKNKVLFPSPKHFKIMEHFLNSAFELLIFVSLNMGHWLQRNKKGHIFR